MSANRLPICARLLTLVAAMPWQAWVMQGYAAADAPQDAASAVMAASAETAVIAEATAVRKQVAKGELARTDGVSLAVALAGPVNSNTLASPETRNALQVAYANHCAHAFLCRFLI